MKQIKYGDGIALKILAADRMGLNPGHIDNARKLLAGEKVHPMFLAQMERESVEMNEKIRHDPALVDSANLNVNAIAKEFGYSVPDPAGESAGESVGESVGEVDDDGGDAPAQQAPGG